MRCKQGDLAMVVTSINPANRSKIVKVITYIGYYQQGEFFEHHGAICQAIITDNYWWIDTAGTPFISDSHGEISRVYAPDTWLRPIRPDGLEDDDVTEKTKELDTVE